MTSPMKLYLPTSGFVTAALLTVARRPQVLLHAQFWDDDGDVYYAQAYAHGWTTLFWPRSGFPQLIPRLVALASMAVSLAHAPVVFAACAIAVRCLPVAYLLSYRCRNLGSLQARIAIGLAYILMPGTAAIQASIAIAHFHLALLAFLVLVASSPQGTAGKLVDLLVLVGTGLSSVFAVLLAPIALVTRRYRVIMLPLACLELGVLAFAPRQSWPLRATPELAAQILGRQIFAGSLLGQVAWSAWPTAVALAAGIAVVAYASVRGPRELLLLIGFAECVLLASLAHPTAILGWPALASQGVGIRYWLIPNTAFLCCLLWLASQPKWRIPARAALALGILGLLWTFRYPKLPDLGFAQQAAAFEVAPKGTVFRFLLNPVLPEMRFTMVLVKR